MVTGYDSPESIRPCLAEQTNSGLSVRTVRVPIFSRSEKWSSSATAELVCVAMADSGESYPVATAFSLTPGSAPKQESSVTERQKDNADTVCRKTSKA